MESFQSICGLPAIQKAIIQDAAGMPLICENTPVPKLVSGTVLVRTIAVAINPCDWKIPSAFPAPGAIMGYDFAGQIVAIGPDTNTSMRMNDTVCGMVYGSNPADHLSGAFAQYVLADPSLLLRVPLGFAIEQAASFGLGLATNCLALWAKAALGLQTNPILPPSTSPSRPRVHVLVYGGSTATGTMAIQLLKLSGLDPIATCSPHNFDLVKSYGASAVFDYSQLAVADQIRRHTEGRLRLVLDCIADQDSVKCCYEAIGRTGGRYVGLEQCPPELLQLRRAVKACDPFPIAMEIFGVDVMLSGGYERSAKEEKRELAVNMFHVYQALLDGAKLKAHPIELLSGGWESIEKGIALLKSGSVSGKKFVVKLP